MPGGLVNRSGLLGRELLFVVVLCMLVMPVSTASGALRRVSTLGSDTSTCTVLAPCKTLNRAYRVSAPGDVVEVEAGVYGAQTIQDDPTKNGVVAPVVIAPAIGGTVVLGDLPELRVQRDVSQLHGRRRAA